METGASIHEISRKLGLGITRVALFPNLDSLSETIIEEHHIVGYSPPEPPEW